MLKSLTVQNYALIQYLSIDFNNDFSTLTGETGAGKSVLLGALALVLGNRADSSVLNNKNEKCIVEAVFYIKNYKLDIFFNQNDLDYQDETIIRREVLNSGKSRAFVNDTPVNLNVLKELSKKLIDIHSQHENIELNNSSFQLGVLDAIANNSQTLKLYQKVFNQYKKHKKDLELLVEKSKTAETDYDFNLFQLNQLSEINLDNLDITALESELETLNHTEEIQLNLHQVFDILSDSENSVSNLIKETQQSFEKIIDFYPQAKQNIERIKSISIDIKDIASETEQNSENFEYNPERALHLKELLDKIYSLQQKHQATNLDELVEVRNSYQNKVESRESFNYDIEKLEKELSETEKELSLLAKKLTESRIKASPKLSDQIIILLSDLGMPYAIFSVETNTGTEYNFNGLDTVNFMFSANKNATAKNISKIASGGETSRLMLAIKYILSKKTLLPTIIFDEIDTGVSGEMADKMADIMNKMAANMQVISITHLPQIAACGKNQYKVYKNESDKSVETQILKLSDNERIEEIARMLSGREITVEAVENAKRLISSRH